MNGAQEGCVQIKAGTEHTPFPKMGGEYTCLPLQWVLLCPSAEPAFDHLDITSEVVCKYVYVMFSARKLM